MIGDQMLGRMCSSITRHGPTPSERAASTNSCSRTRSTWARATRA